ncbi:MAG: UDP-N-acetylglucosamine 1-carboxyvinyltransferase [Spirochaetes bacterium GWF1_41_5]|nr:MAG: UDP-N-acetylglucosamine 1-carboxyvinyltransferase [Spirochaetes bacterium GWF1_41_5]HBE02198.1 UDP-N-acetylglucosamine 1-carboxyvinyltransferase [Spirochaetia bacterium]
MKKYIINGRKSLKGTVNVSGSKNAALPVMAASLLTDDDLIINNVPCLRDTQTMISLLSLIGKKVIIEKSGRIIIRSSGKLLSEAPYEIVKQMRASIVVLGPLLAKTRKASVSLPGGCAIGPRPVDLHIKGLEAIGAKIRLEHGYIKASARRLKGGRVNLLGKFGSTVLGTDNVMMAAALTDGTTIIENAAREPETTDLAELLISMGAKIRGLESSTLEIRGMPVLHGAEHTVIPDRIEAGTFLAIAACTKGKFTIKNCRPAHLANPVRLLSECGIHIETGHDFIKIDASRKFRGFSAETQPYPDFPTDLASQFTVAACMADGISTITDTLFPQRFNHVPELLRMGAEIKLEDNTAIITGGKTLQAANILASDLRAGAALVAAGLAAEGTTEVRRIYHIERGYEDFHSKLSGLGGRINCAADSLL